MGRNFSIFLKIIMMLLIGLVFAVMAYFGTCHVSAAWYGPRYIRSDNDIGDLIMISLGVCCLAFILGGWVGYRLHGRMRRRSNTPEHSHQGEQ